MIMIWYVALGPAAGGVTRFLFSTFVQRALGTTFPAGRLVINITGSLLVGFLIRYALATPAVSPEMRALLTTGFCGGYTTFSTFSYETATLLEDGDHRRALVYVVRSVGVSLAGTLAGFAGADGFLALRRGG